jgi:type I restriction enzyme M protein
MTMKRHGFNAGDWDTIATRLDEIICAHTGEDPFDEALKLLVAKLTHEWSGGNDANFLSGCTGQDALSLVNRLLSIASERWRGILEPGSSCHLGGPDLLRCAELLRNASLLNGDLVGLDTMFEFIVNKAAKGQKGQYFTPRYVVDAAVKMVAPGPGELVADPACGSAAFLRRTLAFQPDARVFGFDQDHRATRVSRVMMVASNQPASRVMRIDSLQRPQPSLLANERPIVEDIVRVTYPKFNGFDVIVTNPPFAGDVGNEFDGTYELAGTRRVERDILFLERCVELLRPGGRLAIILPHNKVGGSQWAFAREWLLRHMRVVGVVGLGRNTFQPHTSQKACLLVAVKRHKPLARPPRDEDIVFFVSQLDGKDARGRVVFRSGQTGIVDHDLDEAVEPVLKATQRRKMGDSWV